MSNTQSSQHQEGTTHPTNHQGKQQTKKETKHYPDEHHFKHKNYLTDNLGFSELSFFVYGTRITFMTGSGRPLFSSF